MLAIVCPGQGSQVPGFLSEWAEVPGVADHLGLLSEAAQTDLLRHGTVSDADTIRDTAVAQPLIVASGIAVLRVLFPSPEDSLVEPHSVSLVAGHSVGEITAAAACGVLAPPDAVAFVRERGRAMAAAAQTAPTGMSAVLGGEPDEVDAHLAGLGLVPANRNGAGQTVAAGPVAALEALQKNPPPGARVIALQVAGAFHSPAMASAEAVLERIAADLPVRDPLTRVLSNADGEAVAEGKEFVARLVGQVSRPVRWDLCMASMASAGITAVLELPPAGTLSNLVKRALPGVPTLALRSPAQLEAARSLIAEHGRAAGAHSPGRTS